MTAQIDKGTVEFVVRGPGAGVLSSLSGQGLGAGPDWGFTVVG